MTGLTRRRTLSMGAIVAVALSLPATAAPADLKPRADAIVAAALPADGPGGVVVITERGKIVYAGARGLADVATRRPIIPDTVFRLGSITKQFAAAVVLQLVAEGKLSLDDTVSKFVAGYPRPGGDVTVRQLLNHTSGIQSYTGIPGWMVEANTARAFTTAEMIAQFRDMPARFQPGQDHAYNNSGYVLVGAVIEAVTGKPWHVAVEERIARPLGLKTLRYGVGEETIANRAMPYTMGANGVEPAQKIHMSVPHAAGGLVGSVRDLATWAAALHHGKVVRADLYAQMIAPTSLPDGRTIPYGFALSTGDVRGAKWIGHNGGIPGGLTDSLYIPDRDVFVAVFVNSDAPAVSPGVTARRLAALAIDKPFPAFVDAGIDPATLAPLFGIYTSADSRAERRISARDGKLYVQRTGAEETRLLAAGDDRFFYGPSSLSWFQIRRDPAGAHVMEFHPSGSDTIERAVRTGPVPAVAANAVVPRAALERNVGRYALGPMVATVALAADGRLTVQLTGQPINPMRTVTATEFAIDAVGATILFEGAGATASALVLRQGGRDQRALRVADAR